MPNKISWYATTVLQYGRYLSSVMLTLSLIWHFIIINQKLVHTFFSRFNKIIVNMPDVHSRLMEQLGFQTLLEKFTELQLSKFYQMRLKI